MPDDTFLPNLVQIGQETAEKRWREKKKKKSKPTEKYNITSDFEKFHFYKNGNIINNPLNSNDSLAAVAK